MFYEVEATWIGDVYSAVSPRGGDVWVSADGDEWFFDLVGGEHVSGEPFESSCIRLDGGPRDGEVVA